MVLYAEDAVLERHPDDSDGLATGKSEILVIETSMDGLQGSSGSMEFLNMEVSSDTVTYDNIFRNRSGECSRITPISTVMRLGNARGTIES